MKIKYVGAEYFQDLLERPNSVIVRVASAVRRNFPKCNLIRKNPGFYAPKFSNTREGLEYIWPTTKPNAISMLV